MKPEQQARFDRPALAHRELVVYCTWNKNETRSELGVLLAINGDHFNEVFQEGYFRKWLLFEPRTVRGQPAVVVSDSPNPSYCEVVVATGPRDAIEVRRESGTNHEDSCAMAVEFADQMVGNLGG